MEEGILDIQLMHRPGALESQGEDGADCSWLHHGTEGLSIVNAGPLSEAAEDPASLVAL
jgi:hypothetical protein